MELNILVPNHPPLNPHNNNNNSNCSTPYISAPSSPQRPLNFFYSAPSSPRRFSLLSDNDFPSSPSAVVPFDWEFQPGVPKPLSSVVTTEHEKNRVVNGDDVDVDVDDDFEFEFSGQLDMIARPSISSADELFSGGKIRPLKPPPPMITTVDSPRSPMSKFKDAISPKHRKKTSKNDPFEEAMKTATTSGDCSRGRTNFKTNSRKGISRSLSPLRVSEFALHQQDFPRDPDPSPNQSGSGSGSRWGSRKWRLKDFLLFRSASEGRATSTEKDPLRNKKYYAMTSARKGEDEGSFRSTSSVGEGTVSRRRGQVSAHERLYMTNRAVLEEQKKKTSLPYKNGGILSCLGFNPALHDISKAFGAFSRS